MIVLNIPGEAKETKGESEDGQMLLQQQEGGGKEERESEQKGCVVDEEKKTDCYEEEESRDLYTEIEETEVLRVPPPPPPPPLPPRQVTLRRCSLHFICTLSCAELFSPFKQRISPSKQSMHSFDVLHILTG